MEKLNLMRGLLLVIGADLPPGQHWRAGTVPIVKLNSINIIERKRRIDVVTRAAELLNYGQSIDPCAITFACEIVRVLQICDEFYTFDRQWRRGLPGNTI